MPHAAPGLNVTDVRAAIAWYERTLGFSRGFVVPGEDPPYALIHREGLTLHLRKRPDAAGTSFCYLEVDDIERWNEEFIAAGVPFLRTIENSSYGMRDFELMDCCGNLIGVGQPSV